MINGYMIIKSQASWPQFGASLRQANILVYTSNVRLKFLSRILQDLAQFGGHHLLSCRVVIRLPHLLHFPVIFLLKYFINTSLVCYRLLLLV